MQQHLKKFIIKLLLLTLIITIAGIIFFVNYKDLYNPLFPFVLLFFFLLTLIVHSFLIRANRNPRNFPRVFLSILGLKLLLLFVVLLVCLFFYKSSIIPLAVIFISLYLVFQIFEVISLLTYLKKTTSKS